MSCAGWGPPAWEGGGLVVPLQRKEKSFKLSFGFALSRLG